MVSYDSTDNASIRVSGVDNKLVDMFDTKLCYFPDVVSCDNTDNTSSKVGCTAASVDKGCIDMCEVNSLVDGENIEVDKCEVSLIAVGVDNINDIDLGVVSMNAHGVDKFSDIYVADDVSTIFGVSDDDSSGDLAGFDSVIAIDDQNVLCDDECQVFQDGCPGPDGVDCVLRPKGGTPLVHVAEVNGSFVVWECLPHRGDKAGRAKREEVWVADKKIWNSSGDGKVGKECVKVILPFFGDGHVVDCRQCLETRDSRDFITEFLQVCEVVTQAGGPNYSHAQLAVPSDLNIEEWRCRLEGYRDAELLLFLEYGWPVGLCGPVAPRDWVKNHKGALEFTPELVEYVGKEVRAGHVLGPFASSPFPGRSVVSPLNTVAKKDSQERRVVLDLSFPNGASVNDAIPKDSFLGIPAKLHLPSVDNLVALVRKLGKGCLLFKRDLRKAFRQIPVDPLDVHVLCYEIEGHFYVDRVEAMGLRSACQACQRVTDGVVFIFEEMGYCLVNYIDDLAAAEVPHRAQEAFEALGGLLADLGLKESVNKACPPSTTMMFLGICLDTLEGTLTIPQDKLQEIGRVLEEWTHKRSATRKEVQSLVGSLNFMAACVRPGRIFISRLLNFLRGLPDTGRTLVPSEVLKDVRWWQVFAPLFNGVAMMPLADWSAPDAEFASDACLSGAGGCFGDRFFHKVFPPCIAVQDLHITALELLTVMVCLKLWSPLLRGERIKIHCDNMAAVTVLNTGRSKDSFLQACLREICLLVASYEVELRAVHIYGIDNRLPDLCSRWDLDPKYKLEFSHRTADRCMFEEIISDDMFLFSHNW